MVDATRGALSAGPQPPAATRREAATLGMLAAGPALAVLLVGRLLSGRPGFLEQLADGFTRFLPLDTFEAGLSIFGPLAKGLVYLGVLAGVVLAGALLAVATRGDQLRRGMVVHALVVAAFVLALAELVVLPLFGAGVLGTTITLDRAALHAPLVVAALAFGVTLAGLRASRHGDHRGALGGSVGDAPAVSADGAIGRRSFLGRTLWLVGVSSLAGSFVAALGQVLGAARSGGSGSVTEVPVTSDPFGPTPALTPVDEFYQVSKNLVPPAVDGEAWRLIIDGLVDSPQSLSLADLRAMPSVEGYRTLECISLEIVRGDRLISNQVWRGTPLVGLFALAGVQPAASWVLWEAEDGYTESLPLDEALDPQTWIVYDMGGAPLTPEHGFPARVLIAGRFGMKQPKWLRRITLASADQDGYWEQRGWDREAVVLTMSRIDQPRNGDAVPVGRPFAVTGIANSGERGISRVELSPDGGATWLPAELQPLRDPLGPLTWVRWRLDVTLPQAGAARLVVRATDGTGAVQDGTERSSLPAGSTGWHAIGVSGRTG